MPSPATEGERGWEGTLSGERVERRLTALLAADVAGYSRLMGADAEGTLAAPKAIRRELVVELRGPPCRDDHGGRDADAAGRCRIRKRRKWVAVAATGTAGTSPSRALGMMSTPPPRDHRLYARGNALSKAAPPPPRPIRPGYPDADASRQAIGRGATLCQYDQRARAGVLRPTVSQRTSSPRCRAIRPCS
jgi:hypothetical protein